MQQAQSTLSFAHEGGQVNSSSLRSAGEESRGCCAIVAECEIHVCGRTTPDESTEKASAGSETKTARAAAFVCCHPTPAAQSVSPGARNGCCASERRQTHAASRGGQVAFPLLLFFASRGPLSTLRLCATATGVSQRRRNGSKTGISGSAARACVYLASAYTPASSSAGRNTERRRRLL